MSKVKNEAVEKSNGEPALVRAGPTYSERFLAEVEKQFLAEMGQGVQFTALEKRLAQHVYLAVDQALKTAEADRIRKNKGGAEYTWHNIDRQKLAIDTVHRVSLGLDALIPNHIWPVSYFNSSKKLYDVDLRIGYTGRDYVARRHALETPVDVIYQLVHATDTFKALPRSSSREVEGYDFEITSPFDRGAIVGGFGYVSYEDPRKNKLVIVTPRDFNRSMGSSKSDFWKNNDLEMHLKTVVHRTASKIPVDPEKVNASAYSSVMEDERDAVARAHDDVEAQVVDRGHKQLVDFDPQPTRPAPEADGETLFPEIEDEEALEAVPF